MPAMTYRAHVRAVLLLGLPLVGGHLAQMAIGITDTVMLGRYGVTELAAIVIAASYFFTVFLLGAGFAHAVMPMVAEADAAGDETQIRRTTRMGMWISILYAAICMPLFIWSGPVLNLLGQENVVADLGQSYLRIAGIGLFPALLTMVLKSYFSALECTGIVLWSMVGGAILNGLANYALIFGNWGMPELGMEGAAIASVMTQSLSLLILIHATRKSGHELFARLWRPDPGAFREVLYLGAPIGLTLLAEVGLFSAAAVMVGWVGLEDLAAHGIAVQLASITFMVHLGLGGVATIRAGHAVGHRDALGLRRGALTVLTMSLVFSLVTVVIFITLPEPLINLFLDPEEPARGRIVEIGIVLVALAALFQLADGAQAIGLGLLRGVKDARVPMLLATFSYWIVGVPSGYVFSQKFGLGAPGVWIGLVFGLICAAVLLNYRFWKGAMPSAIRPGQDGPGRAEAPE